MAVHWKPVAPPVRVPACDHRAGWYRSSADPVLPGVARCLTCHALVKIPARNHTATVVRPHLRRIK
jgi:hypothetical protein